ncbi:MAG: ARPP-1 family domain-containing protein [Xanthobacteraceae bacterium]
MLDFSFRVLAAALVALFAPGLAARGYAADGPRVTGPVLYNNLSVYLVHGESASGPVPLTLEEALARGVVNVRETGSVNQLEIENLGTDAVFAQSGDIVKGGRQDRVLMVSLLLPAQSGRVAIASFCVEQGRWSARGSEDVRRFLSSSAFLPSREAKLVMRGIAPAADPARAADRSPATDRAPAADRAPSAGYAAAADTGARQAQMWNNVANVQNKLAGMLRNPVAAPQSPSSLQLTLENEKLEQAQNEYLAALAPAGTTDTDVVGYAFAINGKLSGADIYPSNGLFRKMWLKLLRANATEAISEKASPSGPPPSIEDVVSFLDAGNQGNAVERKLTPDVQLETRDTGRVLYLATKPAAPAAAAVHKSYLAK